MTQGKAVVVTMTERRSRLHLLAHSPDGTADNVMRAIVRQLGRLRRHVHTLTSDNGKEFAEHQLVACALKADFYFADPYSAWQRGSVAATKTPTVSFASTCLASLISARSPTRSCAGSSNACTTVRARYSDSKRPSKSSPRNLSAPLRIKVEATIIQADATTRVGLTQALDLWVLPCRQ